jgi:DNA-binding MarR family transcriptional regulator/GNAT superfamily N-acetyltransferase
MDAAQVRQVRRFNRVVTQRVGALDDSYLRLGRPLGEARVIYETGADGTELSAMRARLGFNSGYLSRLLRSLESQGVVAVRANDADRRARRAVLTPKGRRELASYDRLSDELAESMLVPLSVRQRERLVAAMAEVERLIGAASIAVSVEPPGSEDARHCLGEYFRELAERFDAGFDPTRSNPASDADMTPPAGFFLVARLDGVAVGCGALKRLDDTTGEIKRMWTAPAARGLGVARKVLQALEAKGREIGLATMRLETNRTLTEAQALYRESGYREVPAFNNEPYAHHWFEKRLDS